MLASSKCKFESAHVVVYQWQGAPPPTAGRLSSASQVDYTEQLNKD